MNDAILCCGVAGAVMCCEFHDPVECHAQGNLCCGGCPGAVHFHAVNLEDEA